ncbi:HipA domain-containing protein [Microbacterium testaceum]|uniref:hypothetical protein n=1 Tax=Microbacterium testaceum TaxID=2033 RepID=UPI002AC51BD3|nr:hypothetical protein [Microbacterium testaceum]MDZ5144332.1 hypothetical protein [Microbacterium testaceum]
MGGTGARIDVSDWDFIAVEPKGASAKYWIRRPGGSSSRPSDDWLFKPSTFHDDGSRQAGDWAEVASSVIATALEIPAAKSVLAVRDDVEGVLVQNVRPAGYDMVTGRMAMLNDIEIHLRDSARDKTASVGHTVENVFRVLDGYGPVPDSESWAGCTAADVMVGYMFLDSLIANGDRHEQNWSVLRATSSDSGLPDAISATYDLEASLGFQLTDEARASRLLDRRGMQIYARKGLARRFDGNRKSTLVEVAAAARTYCSERGRARVSMLLEAIAATDYDVLLAECGPVSEVTRTFAAEVLKINGRRISDAT